MKTLKAISLVCLCLLTGSFIASGASAAKSANSPTTPLTFANAVSFFKAAKFRATEVQPRCVIFFEGEWKSANVYNYGVIMVENSDEDIQVTFYLTDAHEMNWVTEFLDSQFFNRNETEKLFQLMNAGPTCAAKTSDASASISIIGSRATHRFWCSASRLFDSCSVYLSPDCFVVALRQTPVRTFQATKGRARNAR